MTGEPRTQGQGGVVLEHVFATMDEGVAVFDETLRLVVANRRFREIFDLPERLCVPGTAFAELLRFNAERGDYGPGDPAQQVRERLELARRREPHQFERERPDGTVLEIRGRPLPNGGFVTVAGDITQRASTARALRDSKAVLEATFEHMDQGISIANADLILVGMNRRFQELLDFPASLCQPGTPFEAFIRYNAERGDYGPGDPDQQVRERVELARGMKPHLFERERPDGTVLEIRGTPMPGGGFVTVYTDVTKRARAERALRESEARFRALTELSSDWYWEQDTALRFTRIEGRHVAEGKYAAEAELGRGPWELGFEPEGGRQVYEGIVARRERFRDLVMRRPAADGSIHYLEVSGEPLFDRVGQLAGYRGVARDITPQKRAEERIQYLARHDGLTGLPNRVHFGELLQLTLEAARRYQRKLAVLFIDLDGFKEVNDSLGHDAGDALLRELAARFKRCLRASDVVGRLGGDEFVAMVQEVHRPEQVAAVARKVLEAAAEPVAVLGTSRRVSASIGICMYPAEGQDEQALLKNADRAMYQAKQKGRNRYEFFAATGTP